ncbi:MAG: BACON domain-containing protein, partial [Candidatus Mariimomonas ferrooxydans]
DEVSKTIALSCSYSISPTSKSLGYSSGSVSVTAQGGCAWIASSNASWLTITSGSSGSGNGTVNYSAAANSGTSSRIGTMTIAGQTFTVYQSVLFGTPTIPVPIGQQSFPYDPTTTPEASPNPAEAMPVGVGDVATGGDTLTVQVNLGQFSAPVDIYGAYMLSTDPDNIYVLNPDLTFQVFSFEEFFQALSDGAFPVGIEPWIENTIGLIDETLFEMPTSELPTGIYYPYALVTPAGSLDNYYLWET